MRLLVNFSLLGVALALHFQIEENLQYQICDYQGSEFCLNSGNSGFTVQNQYTQNFTVQQTVADQVKFCTKFASNYTFNQFEVSFENDSTWLQLETKEYQDFTRQDEYLTGTVSKANLDQKSCVTANICF